MVVLKVVGLHVGEYGGSGSREEPVSSCGTAPPPRLGDHTTEVRGDCC